MLQVDETLRRYNSAKTRAMLYWSLNERAYRFVVPDRNLYNTQTQGANKNAQVFDTTTVKAAQKFVSKVQSFIIPAGEQWVKLKPGAILERMLDEMPDGDFQRKQVDKELQDETTLIFKYLDKSNFALMANEAFYDLVIGTSALLCNEGDSDDQPLNFVAVPLRYYYPEEGPYGVLQTHWHEMPRIPARNIKQMWPNATLSAQMQIIVRDRGDTEVPLIEGTVYEADKNRYCYTVITEEERKVIYEEYSESSAWISFRWSRLENETYGRGPAIFALPTVRSLNLMGEYEFSSAAFKATPMYTGFSDGVFNPNTITLKPNTIIPVNPASMGGNPLQPVATGGDVNFGQTLMTDLRQQIANMFFNDPLGPVDAPKMTATEVAHRMQMFAEEVGPAFGRLQVEFLAPLIKRVVYILRKRGLIGNIVIDGKQVDLAFESPLAQTKAMQEIAQFQEFYATLQNMYGPQLALGILNPTKVPQWLAERYNVAMDLLKGEEELNGILQALQQQKEAANEPQPGVSQLPTQQQG